MTLRSARLIAIWVGVAAIVTMLGYVLWFWEYGCDDTFDFDDGAQIRASEEAEIRRQFMSQFGHVPSGDRKFVSVSVDKRTATYEYEGEPFNSSYFPWAQIWRAAYFKYHPRSAAICVRVVYVGKSGAPIHQQCCFDS